ncbi:hypothetical protein BN1263170099 [Stenotrophomonas indicatrix]|nr:hypothetical protein BN1263170099 [Stenotrophomonas indicatrix]
MDFPTPPPQLPRMRSFKTFGKEQICTRAHYPHVT